MSQDERKAFETVLGRLLRVPKKEVDRVVARRKKRRAAKKQSRKSKQ